MNILVQMHTDKFELPGGIEDPAVMRSDTLQLYSMMDEKFPEST